MRLRDESGRPARERDGQVYRIGRDVEVAWIQSGVAVGRAITAAVPPVFEAYATIAFGEPDEIERADAALMAVLEEMTAPQPWWLGYLNTGASDIVFSGAPMVTLYYGWHYVLIEAGPREAVTLRGTGSFKYSALPDLMFPADRSWLVSILWDDDWRCVGGPTELIERCRTNPDLPTRVLTPEEDATPPGFETR